MAVGGDGDGVGLGVGGDGELDVVALALFFLIGDVFVGNVSGRAVGAEVFMNLVDGLERFCIAEVGGYLGEAALRNAVVHDGDTGLQAPQDERVVAGIETVVGDLIDIDLAD
jgi:hypothetical protein